MYMDDETLVGLHAVATRRPGVPRGPWSELVTLNLGRGEDRFDLHLLGGCPRARNSAPALLAGDVSPNQMGLCQACSFDAPQVLSEFALEAASATGVVLVAREALARALDGNVSEAPLDVLTGVNPSDEVKLARAWHLMHARRLVEDRGRPLEASAAWLEACLADMDAGEGNVPASVRVLAQEVCDWVRMHVGLKAELDRQVDALSAESLTQPGRQLGLAMVDVLRDSPLPCWQGRWSDEDWAVMPLALGRVADDGVFALLDVPAWAAAHGRLDDLIPWPDGFDAATGRVVLGLVVDLDLTLAQAVDAAVAATTG